MEKLLMEKRLLKDFKTFYSHKICREKLGAKVFIKQNDRVMKSLLIQIQKQDILKLSI